MGRRGVWVLILGAMLLPVLGSPTIAVGQVPIDPNPFLDLIPALRTAPAPGWVTQGTRITFYSAAVSLQGGQHHYTADPDNPNCRFRDERGNCYRQDQLRSGGSGEGFTQVNVALLDRSVAALEVRSYGLVGPNGPVIIRAFGGVVGLPGAGGDSWLNPQVLRRAVGLSGPGIKVVQMPYVLNGRQYTTIRFQGEGTAWVYDAETGALLLSDSATQGAPIQGPLLPTDSRQGMTLLTEAILMGVRTPNIPWALDPAPEWVGRFSSLQYKGTAALFVPGSPPLPVAVATSFQRQTLGNNWARYIQTQVQGAPPGMPPTTSQVVRVFGSAQFGGLWVPPRALSQLRSGQTLDTDPVTKVTVLVGQIGRTAQGREFVTITEACEGHRLDERYDRATGMLLHVNQADNVLHTLIQLDLAQLQ